jgi:hypothetical protein
MCDSVCLLFFFFFFTYLAQLRWMGERVDVVPLVYSQ